MPYRYPRLGLAASETAVPTSECTDISPEEVLKMAQELVKVLSSSVSNKADEAVEANQTETDTTSESDDSGAGTIA